MIMQEKYDKVLTVCRRYKVIEKENVFSKKPGYLPTIAWYFLLSKYKSGEMDFEKLKLEMEKTGRKEELKTGITELIQEIGHHVPELLSTRH